MSMLAKIKNQKLVKQLVFSDFGRKLLQFLETLLWGGRFRRSLTRKLLLSQYKSKFRHDWIWANEPPHFSDNEHYESTFENPSNSAYLFYRGLLTAEILKQGDKLLDIGCGDGFYNYRFYSHKCKSIDAIDIESSAITYAKQYNSSENINYVLQDAVNQPFPSKKYDVIAWDGAIGHFPPETTTKMLNKIVDALEKDGVFTGSESLGHEEGHDHLQFFETIYDFGDMLKKHFKYVSVRETSYPISSQLNFIRREAYWRCSNSENFSNRFGWVMI
jgi:SAM-dependent methyltransferase